jgi:streptogramin lyase
MLVTTCAALAAASLAQAATVTSFSTGVTQGSGPLRSAMGPDGNVWYVIGGTPFGIGRFNTATGTADEFTAGFTAPVYAIAAGPDGNLWFTQQTRPGLGRITPSGAVEELPALPVYHIPTSITAGPDGNLWFTEDTSGYPVDGTPAIGRLNPVTRHIDEFPVTTGQYPEEIGAGPGGHLWFTESEAPPQHIGYITTAGAVTEFPPGPLATRHALGAIVNGPDGNAWFVEPMDNRIGRITPSGVITEIADFAPTIEGPEGIVTAADGNLWVTEGDAGASVARVTPAGAVTEFAHRLPANTAPGDDLFNGRDGNLWSTTYSSGPGGVDGVMRISLDEPPVVSTGAADEVGTAGARLSGSVNPLGAATTWSVQYGTTDAYGLSTAEQSLPAGAAAVPVSASVAGLAPGTLYHYRVAGTNASGTGYGADATFTTTASPLAPAPVFPPACTLAVPSARVTAGRLKLTVRCDQTANVSLSGQIKQKSARVASKRAGATAAKVKTIRLRRVVGLARRDVALVLSVKLTKRVVAALQGGAKDSAKFTLIAANANGTTTVTKTLKRLTIRKPSRR